MPENGSGGVVCSSSLLLCSHPGRRQAETPLIQPVQKSRASSDGPDRLGAAGARWGVSSSGCGGVGAVTTARLSRRGRVTGEGWRTVKRPDQENQLCDRRFKRVGLNWT